MHQPVRRLCLLPFLLFCLLVAGIGSPAPGRAAVPLPAFSLPSVTTGEPIASDTFHDKALLITFFATWCPPCRQEIPTLIQLQKEFGPQGFSVIGMSVDEDGSRVVAKLIKETGINYPVVLADRSIQAKFGGINGIPTSFLVNRRGHVVRKYPGFIPHALLQRDIQDILQ